MSITDQTFDGLAFPVAKVTYNGDSSNWSATIKRDHVTYRARLSYDHKTGGGARGALPAARKVLEKLLTDSDGLRREGEYVAIPGDHGNAYTFTFVPVEILNRHATPTLSADARTFVGLLAHPAIDTTNVFASLETWQETREAFPVDPDEHRDPLQSVYVIR